MFGAFAEGVRFPQGTDGVLRVQENFERRVYLLNGRVQTSSRSEDRGVSALFFGGTVRGFASTTDFSARGAQWASDAARKNLDLLAGPCGVRSPASAPVTARDADGDREQRELTALALRTDERVRALCPGVSACRIELLTQGARKRILTSGGTDVCSLSPRTNLYLTLSLPDGNGTVSLRDSIGGRGFSPRVLEDDAAMDAFIRSLREDLESRRGAPLPDSGEYPCILDGCSGLLIHEALGHIAEGDSVLAGSALAGRMGQRIVSPLISVVDAARTLCGRDAPVSLDADDEGTPAADAPILRGGVLTGYLHSRATAEKLGAAPTGNARADRFCDIPIVRMRSTAILPGTSSLEEMLSSMGDGIYVKRVGSGQADQTGKFSLSVTCARRVRNGRLAEPLGEMLCSGNSFRTLSLVDMVGDTLSRRYSGLCGKQGQTVPVGMDGPALKTVACFNGR